MKPIVLWYKQNKDTMHYEYNHLSVNLAETYEKSPPPKSAEQKKSWPNAKWISKLSYMTQDGVVHD